MKRLLVYDNRKIDPCYWDVSNAELEAGAFLALFKTLDEDWNVYFSLKEKTTEDAPTFPDGHPEGCFCDSCKSVRDAIKRFPGEQEDSKEQRRLYKLAAQGDADAARALCEQRNTHEYERFHIRRVDEAKGKYAPVLWGDSKNCAEAFIDENHFAIWKRHGSRGDFRLQASAKEVEKRFTELSFIMTRLPVLEPVTVKFRPQRDMTEERWLSRELGIDSPKNTVLYAQGLAMLKLGEYTLVNPYRIIQKICGAHLRESKRFD